MEDIVEKIKIDKLEEFIKGNIKADFTRQIDQFYYSNKDVSIVIKPFKPKEYENITTLHVYTSNDYKNATYLCYGLKALAFRANEIIKALNLKDTQTKLL